MTTTDNLSALTEMDFIVLIDASGSMAKKSTRYEGKTRWQEGQETIFGIASELHKYDSNGIDIVVFGGNVEMHENVTPDKVEAIFANRDPRGDTPLAEALQKVVTKWEKSGKHTVALCFTDGEPNNKMAAAETIINASKKMQKDEELTFLFVQIGDDKDAERYLNILDEGLTGAKFDIVDTVKESEAKNMTARELVIRAIAD